MQDSRLTICRNVFFQTDSAVQACCESLDKHKIDLFENINTSIVYKENEIVLDHNMLNIDSFLVSDNQILLVDGEAGSGKSALVKRIIENFSDGTAFLAFKSIDMDVDDKLRFLSLHGVLKIDELLGVYKDADIRIVYIDSAEKYFSMENQHTFEELLQIFIKAGWKLIFTIRTTYKESFHNILLNKVKVQQYHVDPIQCNKLLELSDTYGFILPEDKKLLELLGAPFYLKLYLSLDDLEDEKNIILNREIFEKKIWEDIIRNNRKRKNNMPTRREDALLSITMDMLENENYQYEIQPKDDYDAFEDLEQAGILNQTNDARKYYYSHDVYEELAANHIFTQQYNMNIGADKFFTKFRTSLRVRKLFHGWMTYFAATEEHQDIIFNILECKDVDKVWKEEVLLTVISKEHLKDIYYKITSDMANLSNKYYPASAYKTPIINLLQNNQKAAKDFLIRFCNKTGKVYLESDLNKDYKECRKIMIYVKGQGIEQIASERLWKMYRGTHVGSDLLVSLLMGFETWLLNVVKYSDDNLVIDFCRDVLIKSKNVMLTAVIVSISEAYPEKMVDIVCDFLKTKEIFHFDSERFLSEGQASFLLHGDNIFEEERRESNKLPHRRKRLEDIILQYQTNRNGISEEEYGVRLEKIYRAIDDATKDIAAWQTSDKYAYYRMDLRHYKRVVNVEPDNKGNYMCMVMPDFSEDMEELSKESRETSNYHFQYMDLQLWSDYKFNGNEKFKEYDKYSNILIVLKELEELWGFLCNYNDRDNSESEDQSFLFHRYLSIVPYTCAVLLRDFGKDLRDRDRDLCRHIIFELGYLFSEISDFEFAQAGNGVEAVTLGLTLLINGENTKKADNENPLYLLLKLVLRDWSDDSCIVKQIANAIWKQSPSDGWKLVYLFSLLADQYEIQIMKHRELSLYNFLESYQQNIEQVLMKDSIGVTDINFTKLSGAVTFAVISFISVDMKEAFKIVELTKDKTIRITFGNNYDMKEERRNLIGYTLNFIVWFADVLLYCDSYERKVLITSFTERADIIRNEHVQELLKWLIIDQEVYGKTDEFWSIWELLKSKMIELGNKEEYDYYASCNVPFGGDRVITTYLFANSAWQKNVHRCVLLSEERAAFFTDFIEKSRSLKAMFYALAKLLNTVGMETYKEIGIEWIDKLTMKDPECRVTFYDNTLFYFEEYIGSFVVRHRMEFRENTNLLQKVQTVLEYMMSQGSQIAFFLREEI